MDSDNSVEVGFSPQRNRSHFIIRRLPVRKTKTSPATINSDVNSERAIVPTMAGPEPATLSRLRCFSNTMLDENFPSSRLRESYSSAAEVVRKTLISNLTSEEDMGVEFMIDLANAAFESLRSLQADFGDLYDAIKIFIWYQCQLSEAKKERESNESTMAVLIRTYQGNAWLSQTSKPLSRAKTNLAEASADVAAVKARIVETQELLKGLEEKLEIGNKKVNSVQTEVDELESAYKAAKAKVQVVAKQIEEMKKTEQKIDKRCEDARAGIERVKATLSTL